MFTFRSCSELSSHKSRNWRLALSVQKFWFHHSRRAQKVQSHGIALSHFCGVTRAHAQFSRCCCSETDCWISGILFLQNFPGVAGFSHLQTGSRQDLPSWPKYVAICTWRAQSLWWWQLVLWSRRSFGWTFERTFSGASATWRASCSC